MNMKKRLFYLLIAWLLCLSNAMADDLFISNVTVPKGGTADLPVNFSFTSTTDKVGFTFSLGLPSGISLQVDGDGDPVYEKGSSINKFNIVCTGSNFAGQPQNENTKISGTEGTLLTLHLVADNSLAPGTQHVVNVTKCTFQQKENGSVTDINMDDFTFNVTIEAAADGRVVLNETSTTAPEAATEVNVRVLRTINANTWSTICLPFAMSETQVKTAFGDDVELGDFSGCDATTDADDNVTAMEVKFVPVTAMEANHPYIIKASSSVDNFIVDGVNISPEAEPSVDKDELKTKMGGKWYYFYNSFIGTYVNNTVVPNQCLFLNANNFVYSKGLTKMKAFRAYFNFYYILPEVEDLAGSRGISMSIGNGDGNTTRIENADFLPIQNGHVYSLSGQYLGERQNLGRLPNGIYIIDGKKEVVK